MFKCILALVLMFTCRCSQAQLTPMKIRNSPPTKEMERQDSINHGCKEKNTFTAEQRRKFYPYNKAVKIQAVSFDGYSNGKGLLIERLPIKHDTVCYSQLKEIVTLTQAQTDSLTDIVFNIGYKGPFFSERDDCCFMPHNAILYINSKGKVFAWMEVCFMCDAFEGSKKNITIGEPCNEKYDLLKKWFIDLGIKKGTADESDIVSFEPE